MEEGSDVVASETATLGGGCFWCTEAVFRQLQGVTRVESGYAGGNTPRPSYRDVCSGRTGHAEVVQVEFDPRVLSYRDVLELFFATHDPTTLNRQGADSGTQYRSIVLTHSPEQERVARDVIADLDAQKIWREHIVTTVEPLTEFFPAESDHREYYERNPNQPYCQIVIDPKVAKFRKRFASKLRA
jgi:peptide-methionine (S)-S-oxide reductase